MRYEDLISSRTPVVIYDGDCPFCNTYVQYIRFKSAIGGVKLLDARSIPDLIPVFKKYGYNLNDGMIFILNGEAYYGDKAVSTMSMLSTSMGWFNRINYFIFSKPYLSKVIYPVLVFGRKIVLTLLAREKL